MTGDSPDGAYGCLVQLIIVLNLHLGGSIMVWVLSFAEVPQKEK